MTKNLNKIYDLVKRAKAENRDITEEELKELQDETPKEDETPTECKEKKSDEEVDTPKEDDEIPAEDETPTEDDPKEDDIDDKSDEDVETPMEDENETPTDDDKEDNSNVRMNKNFSLLKTVRSISKNQPLDELTNAVVEQGKSEMRKAGLSAQGQLVIPTNEVRAIHSVTADGESVVATDVFDILTPLRAKNVLAQAGATIYSNLTSDVKIPIMSKSNVTFEDENGEAKDGAGAFNYLKLTPHRLTAYVDISKELLAQDSVDVENAIRTDLVNAINSKLEEAFLSDFSGSTVQPKGVFAVVKPDSAVTSNFAKLVENEAKVEDANILNEPCYILSNKAKAALRAMAKGAKSTELVYENGEVDGTKAYNTSNVPASNYLFGDMSSLVIGTWSGLDLIVDPYTQAAKGAVRLVVNMYVDFGVARPETLVAGKLA
ncbi:phage major capsid protein [Prevotella copri]|uniref:Phage major capsid protein n=1 Tax=Segatella copri TaxID=165179 RepID=A0A6I2TYG7_9BACT|nr:phage major capsid protein [Segatella copri]MST78415.1 phage major capsid protein [Segatella copri]